MKRPLGLFFIFVFLHAAGCIPTLIGGAFYKGSKTKEARQNFTTQFQATNMERESRGLKPLDWCSEAYKFDEGWADNDKKCAARIKAYQNGDTTALDMDAPTVPNKKSLKRQ